MPDSTHLDAHGNARMVDVGGKDITAREAVAEGWVQLSPEGFASVVSRASVKGDVLAIAQLAGIQGAKRTSDLIPLCHPLPLDAVEVLLTPDPATNQVHCVATARTRWRTGVEMEAMVAVSAALLTVYDMMKSVDRAMVVKDIRLVSKHGGKSGAWARSAR